MQAITSTLKDQHNVSVTAYNNGLGLIKDTRAIILPNGTSRLEFQDVAEQIQPYSVSLRSLNAGGSITILEQNYEYDLISPEKLMEKYVGQQVRLVNFEPKLGFSEVKATLLSVNNGPVYRIGEEIFIGHPGNLVLPKLPENLKARPALIWQIENQAAEQEVEAVYLTQGLSWAADYVVTVPKDGQLLDLKGWVTLSNHSGATYANAELKLVAGTVNVAPTAQPEEDSALRSLGYLQGAGGGLPQQEAFGEFHLYTMPRRTTLKQNQSKQLALLEASGITFTTRYELQGQQSYLFQETPAQQDLHAAVYLEFQNESANHLGMPLPAGLMRIYEEDNARTLQFAGEDRIDHTPKDEKVRLKMGEAFDVVVDRVQMEYRVLADNLFESAHEILIKNHKSVDIVVDLLEPMTSEWRLLNHSHEYIKKDAQTLQFQVPVPAGGETRVMYQVQVRQ